MENVIFVIPLTVPVSNSDMKSAALNALNDELWVGGEAILLTFTALETKVGEKVVAPSATFVASLNSPVLLGAVPIFCEINDHYVMSDHVSKLIQTHGCEYVIPVDLCGQPCDMFEIEECTRQKGVTIIEDAAQAHGAKYKNRRVGSFGEAAIFSFYPTKNMTLGGDGGMVTTNNKKIYDSVTKMRDVGRKTKYTHDEIGHTLRLNTVNAAIGLVQLKNLEEWNEKRRVIARNYLKGLHEIGDLTLPPNSDDSVNPVFHMNMLRYMWSHSLVFISCLQYTIQMIHSFFDEKLYEDPKVMEREKKWTQRLI
jgi:perosamine synthetase